jgi:hypothetical protein
VSDLNDLIHTNATIAFNQGVERERERIIKLLERYQGCQDDELCAYTCSCLRSDRFIELIKGELK